MSQGGCAVLLISEFGVKLQAKGFWMLALAHALHLPSIIVQLFQKYAKN